jgi:hypothetical protein
MRTYVINEKFAAAPALAPTDEPSPRVAALAAMFGIGLDETREVVICNRLRVDINPGDVVFITGPSGSGKSVLLRALVDQMDYYHEPLVDLASIDLPDDRPAIDLVGGEPGAALRLLSAAGLADAFALLRRPSELSDGQRWRLRLAMALARVEPRPARPREEATIDVAPDSTAPSRSRLGNAHPCLVADEFCATLDRCAARVVAYRLGLLARERGLTVVVAAANDDLAADLAPTVLITRHEGARVEVRYEPGAYPGPF